VIPNERLMETVERGTSFFDAFRIADDILRRPYKHFGHHYRARHHQSRLRRRESDHERPGFMP